MKQLTIWMALLPIIYSNAQSRTDTVIHTKFYNHWEEMMESDPKDRWTRFAPNEGFQLFERFSSLQTAEGKHAAVIGFYGNATLAWLNGQDYLELAAAGINKSNADSFLYHVVVNDSTEIVPWQHPTVFHSNSKGSYAYLGKFASKNKLIKFEIYQTSQYYNKKTIYYNNLYTPAPVINDVKLLYSDRYLFDPQNQHKIPGSKMRQIGGSQKLQSGGEIEIQKQSFEWSDSISHISLSIKPTLLNEMYHVYLRHYDQTFSDTSLISNRWNISYYNKSPELIINAACFKKPGNYEIIVVAKLPEELSRTKFNTKSSVFFSVKPSALVQFSPKQAISYTAFLVFIGGAGFLFYRDKNKRILEKKNHENQIATMQMRSVRSQLNPHFMFNALSGIQNLVNRQEADKASDYLSSFARITRYILKDTHRDMASVSDEIALLKDYLHMEQLRFGFKYNIDIENDLKPTEIEIPTMLMQPLVENAIKHGVADMGDQGIIEIGFKKNNTGVVLTIKDNGKGFSLASVIEGDGLRLVRERINLLNKIYPATDIHFDVHSAGGFCTCQIQLNHWI